jgi:hypothetical protein
MAIHIIEGKMGEGKSVEALKARITAELTPLIGQHVSVNFHTGEAGLYISFNGYLKMREGQFSVSVVHKEHEKPMEYGGANFTAIRVDSIRHMSFGPVINLR